MKNSKKLSYFLTFFLMFCSHTVWSDALLYAENTPLTVHIFQLINKRENETVNCSASLMKVDGVCKLLTNAHCADLGESVELKTRFFKNSFTEKVIKQDQNSKNVIMKCGTHRINFILKIRPSGTRRLPV